VTGFAAGFSGVGVNWHCTVGVGPRPVGAAAAVVVVRVVATRPATTRKESLRTIGAT